MLSVQRLLLADLASTPKLLMHLSQLALPQSLPSRSVRLTPLWAAHSAAPLPLALPRQPEPRPALPPQNKAVNENVDDNEAPEDEQIDPATLMRGAGEADETTIWEFRAKAFLFDNAKRGNFGLGTLKLNRHNGTGKGRILVRAEGSGRVLSLMRYKWKRETRV
ncbi:hypothetical protein BC830DRAFT_29441 [Chytriomyces sp. MP71]|nr:hypothetical protein BC830DRAFT_29441 [Chytriomyces sp. MP71]